MRKEGIINAELVYSLAALEHTDLCVIGDAGLPVPKGVKLIDLAFTRGTPGFAEVLRAVAQEMTIESYVVAKETGEKNPENNLVISETLAGYPHETVTHEELKKLTEKAKFIIRTGEVTPYSNVILVSSAGF